MGAIGNVLRAATWDRLGLVPGSPLMVYVEMTRRCNLACRHCDIWMTPKRQGAGARPELSADRLVEVLGGLSRRGLLAVDLFGGEPLLREDLCDVVVRLKRAGLHLTVTTNGTLLDGPLAGGLIRAGLDQLLVSLDGPDRGVHDALRGREGTFELVVEGTRRFVREAGSRVRVGFNTLVCRANLARLPEMTDLAASVGVRQIRLVPYHQCHPFNTWAQDDSLLPRGEDVPALRSALEGFVRRAREAGLATNGLSYIDGIASWYEGKVPALRCMAGLAVCDINAYGDLYPCYTLVRPAGNVGEHPFDELWRSEELDRHRRETRRCGRCWQSCYVEPGLRLSPVALVRDWRAALSEVREYWVR